MIRKPPPDPEDRLFDSVHGAIETGRSISRRSKRMGQQAAGAFSYFYAAIFAFGAVATLATSGLIPALMCGAVGLVIFLSGRAAMAKARKMPL